MLLCTSPTREEKQYLGTLVIQAGSPSLPGPGENGSSLPDTIPSRNSGQPQLGLTKMFRRLRMNQSLCVSFFQKREWLLLARGEPHSRGPSLRESASTFYVIVPSRSPTLLVKAVATRELMLPSPFPLLPENPPDDSLKVVEASGALSQERGRGERRDRNSEKGCRRRMSQ